MLFVIFGLTLKLSGDIERVQKVALNIILGENYLNYEVACTLMAIELLEIRHELLCIKFAMKNVKEENSFLKKVTTQVNTSSKPKVVIEPKANYKRYRNSSIPYISRLVNKHA